MKRDLDLIRKILMTLEEYEHGNAPSKLTVDGFTDEQIGYHCFILKEAGFIEATDTTTFGSKSPSALPRRLTWEGHEFIDNARDEKIWIQVKNKIKNTSGTVSISILTKVLTNAVIAAIA